MSVVIHDAKIRAQALDPHTSFIVEAPAGSGKTELLVQRYLSLLAHAVRVPEEILAITFTRKAANEMRSRILHALEQAGNPNASGNTKALAEQVLARDAQLNWQLLENPNRLCIQTIDALCMRLTQKMPIISGMGGDARISSIPEEIYQKSVVAVLESIDEITPWQADLIKIFEHFDNQQSEIESILVDMLKKRDQWLPYIIKARNPHYDLRSQFEDNLQQIILDILKDVQKAFGFETLNTLLPLARYAASHVNETSKIKICEDLVDAPGTSLNDIETWLALAELLLTQAGDIRKQVTKDTGFPAPSQMKDKILKQEATQFKETMHALLAALQSDETLRLALTRLRDAPPAHYSEQSWEFLQALLTVLPIVAAQLTLHFQQYGQVDFIEVASRALQALSDEDLPTDLALVLDYQLRHILVDEFQDTSIMQFRLLEHMVAAWQKEDGRSLFLVGDPMQSIYRFRQANVGLFLKAKQEGIAGVALTPLQLCMNFRSQPELINTINDIMPQIMPRIASISTGAIPFTACIAAREPDESAAVQGLLMNDAASEAQVLRDQILAIKAAYPSWSIAILVRARSHLTEILPALKNAGIAYQAQKIESLAHRGCIHDLLALTRALLHFYDRTAWLALLRSPACGVDLAALNTLASGSVQMALWEAMQDPILLAQLPHHDAARITRLVSALKPTIAARARMPLSDWVRSAWIALGASEYSAQSDENDIEAYFAALNFLEQEYQYIDFNVIETYIEKLYTDEVAQSDVPVQIMTIHAAKGLEFDAVFLPGLSRKNAAGEAPLLRYLEQAIDHDTQWLLAPVHAKTAQTDPIYQYLGSLDKHQQHYETQRLLYVALTRAKQRLYLCAVHDETQERDPAKDSLLALLLPHAHLFVPIISEDPQSEVVETAARLYRLQLDWRLAEPWHQALYRDVPIPSDENKVDTTVYQPDYLMRRQVGILLHSILKYLAEHTAPINPEEMIARLKVRWPLQLAAMGVPQHLIDAACALLYTGIKNTLSDTHGQWILALHEDAACEYALHTQVQQEHRAVVIDRTFVEDGQRWIIDYKSTSAPQDMSIDVFLQQDEQNHLAQLQHYAQVMRQIDTRKIRLGLYYPLIPAWRELV